MRVRSLWCRRIWSDGRHNAFPGIARFGDHYYVTCRHSDGHQDPSASILILRSAADDLATWGPVAEFDIGDDSRDPFVCVVGDSAHVYWHCRKSDWLVRSENGTDWSEPRELETEFPEPPKDCPYEFASDRRWLFRIRRGPDGAYYSLGRCGIASNGNLGLILYRSEDGIVFEATHTFGEGIERDAPKGHEADLAFLDDGVAVAAIRVSNAPGGQGMILCAAPPYREWDGYWAGVRNFGGPCLWRTEAGLLVAARVCAAHGDANCCVWEVTRSGLATPHIVPSGGDCAYQTFADGPNGEALLCYYSSHEWPWRRNANHPADLYLARIEPRPAVCPAF